MRFRKWLSDKYDVKRAYYFIGMIPKEKDLYVFLQKAGYILIFKEVVYNDIGEPKRNCDTNLVLEAVKDYYEKSCDKQILVASDGDYACLAKFLKEKNGLKTVLSPSLRQKCSILLKRLNVPIVFLYDVKNKVEMKKPPLRTEP
ncbi:MAG TPA: NYN domain-containing protein [Candidatus Pacearchaeota archaeon]|nr:NYN domain-containing protein [Candidatus Pacearchaeota archaeon]